MNDTPLFARAREEAERVIRACRHSLGLKASATLTGYPQVWARDSMITLFGAVFIKDDAIRLALRRSLETLARYQSESGCIPDNVHVITRQPNFRAYMDGNMWFVLGHHVYRWAYRDDDFLRAQWGSIKKTLQWLASPDAYRDRLLTMMEACDWQDRFATRGHGLTINALYVGALECAAQMATGFGEANLAQECSERADVVRDAVRSRLWGGRYFIPYLSGKERGAWFDTLGNILAILFDVADGSQAAQILDYARDVGVSDPLPSKAIHPPVFPGQADWREYYRKYHLNLPHQYHNGGSWPFVGGFHVLSLVKVGRFEEAEAMLLKLVEANRVGKRREWEFNEWLHGLTGKPMGKVKQAWSAGMFLWAYEAVKRRSVIHF
ncbi:MAG: glycogen debranching protein [Parcubacteria group bacterium]|nr:glycogen debranching protein [Parcubacteria group bacterium]